MPKGRRSEYIGRSQMTSPATKFFGDVPPLEGDPACEEADPALFDSIDKKKHVKVAVKFCFGCEAKRSCLRRYRYMKRKSTHNGGPEGTWGGRLFNTKGEEVKVARREYEKQALKYE